MTRTKLLGAAAVLAASFTGVAAQANPIILAYSETAGGPLTTLRTTTTGAASISNYTTPDGNFTIAVSGTQPAAGALFTDTVNTTSTTGGTLYIYVAETSIAMNAASFSTGFGNNSQSSSAATVVETSLAVTAGGTYYTLASATVAPGQPMSLVSSAAPAGLGNPFSLLDEFAITFTGANQTVDATLSTTTQVASTSVPEPMSLALLALPVGLTGLIVARRRRDAGLA